MHAQLLRKKITTTKNPSHLEETLLSRTSCCAVVADDRQQIIRGDLRRALLRQERLHVEALQREGHVVADLERIHDLVPETFQVNAKDLSQKHETLRTLKAATPYLKEETKSNK